MRLRTAFTLGLCASLFLAASRADAKKKSSDGAAELPAIEQTRIQPFDDVFTKVDDIHGTLRSARERINSANQLIAGVALSAESTSPSDALNELVSRAGGKLKVVMQGGHPTLKATDAVPAEIRDGIDDVNMAVEQLVGVVGDLKQLPPQVQGLVQEAKTFPGKINADLIKSSGLKATDLPKVAKSVKRDVSATAATPKYIQGLLDEVQGSFTMIQDAVAGGGAGGVVAEGSSSDGSQSTASTSSSPGGGDPVGELRAMIEAAKVAFDDAEVEAAARLLERAVPLLDQQSEVLSTSELLALWRLQAMVAVANADNALAEQAVARAVAVDPSSRPSAAYGPEVTRLTSSAVQSMAASTVRVRNKGTGSAWIDGVRFEPGTELQIVAGEHLVQVEWTDGISSQFQRVDRSTRVSTASSGGAVASLPTDIVDQDPVDRTRQDDFSDLDDLDDEPKHQREPKQSGGGGGPRMGLLIAGGAGVAAGGGLLALSYANEQTFLGADYSGDFGGCAPSDGCWAQAREDQIVKDGTFIRATYAAGYALLGLGAAAVGTSFLATPVYTGETLGLSVQARW